MRGCIVYPAPPRGHEADTLAHDDRPFSHVHGESNPADSDGPQFRNLSRASRCGDNRDSCMQALTRPAEVMTRASGAGARTGSLQTPRGQPHREQIMEISAAWNVPRTSPCRYHVCPVNQVLPDRSTNASCTPIALTIGLCSSTSNWQVS